MTGSNETPSQSMLAASKPLVVVLTGLSGAGKSTAIRSIADTPPISTEMELSEGATAETRMNLSIALALQGKFEDAERIQRIDVPPEMIASNMAYLRALQTDPRRWGELQSGRRRGNGTR